MSDLVFEILRVAVTLAKNEQISKVKALKSRLLDFYPGKDADVDAAISAWGRHARRGT